MGRETHLATIGAAIALTLTLILIAFSGTVHLAGVPVVDMCP